MIVNEPQAILLHGKHVKRIRIERFCIDDPKQKDAFERLALDNAEGRVSFIGMPESIYSQKDNLYYMVVQWKENS